MKNNPFEWGDEHEESSEDVERALESVKQKGDRKKFQRRSLIGTTAAVLVAISVVTSNGLGGIGDTRAPNIATPTTAVSEPPLSLASQVAQTAKGSLATLKSVSATETTITHAIELKDYTSVDSEQTIQYRIGPDGSFWQSMKSAAGVQTETDTRSYSASSGKYTMCVSGSGTTSVECNTNWGPLAPYMQLGQFVSAVENAAQGQNLSAGEITYNGNKTWTLEYDTTPVLSDARLHVKLSVDQETGLPVRLETTVNDLPASEVVLTDLRVNPNFPDSEMHVAIPANATLTDTTKTTPGVPEQLQSFGPGVVAALKGKIPTSTVNGFTTKEVWSTQRARGYAQVCFAADGTGTTNYVEQTSRQGFLTYWTTTIDLTSCPIVPDVSDLMADFNRSRKVKTIVATDGAMKGVAFDIYAQPDRSLFVVGKSDKLLTFTEGNLTAETAQRFVNSFTL